MAVITSLDKKWLREGARDDAEYEKFLQRRASGESTHRILGWREFWGMKFFLSTETLEPRPDSETVIETLIKFFPLNGDRGAQPRLLDLGTGTGCLLLSALKEYPNAAGIGIDQSADAIATAKRNAAENNLSDRAEFLHLDWHDTDKLFALGKFDVVISNPPYIPAAEIQTLQTEVRIHDPLAALDGGADGLAPYRHIIPLLQHLLRPNGIAIFEIGHNQAAAINNILQANQLPAAQCFKDLGGNDRVLLVKYV
jgi:release factor glutamine methyltransferase